MPGQRVVPCSSAKSPLTVHVTEAVEEHSSKSNARDAKADPHQARHKPRTHIRELLLKRDELREEDLISDMLGLLDQLSYHLTRRLRLRDQLAGRVPGGQILERQSADNGCAQKPDEQYNDLDDHRKAWPECPQREADAAHDEYRRQENDRPQDSNVSQIRWHREIGRLELMDNQHN